MELTLFRCLRLALDGERSLHTLSLTFTLLPVALPSSWRWWSMGGREVTKPRPAMRMMETRQSLSSDLVFLFHLLSWRQWSAAETGGEDSRVQRMDPLPQTLSPPPPSSFSSTFYERRMHITNCISSIGAQRALTDMRRPVHCLRISISTIQSSDEVGRFVEIILPNLTSQSLRTASSLLTPSERYLKTT